MRAEGVGPPLTSHTPGGVPSPGGAAGPHGGERRRHLPVLFPAGLREGLEVTGGNRQGPVGDQARGWRR